MYRKTKSVSNFIVMDVLNVEVPAGFKFSFCKSSFAILEYYFVDVILERS